MASYQDIPKSYVDKDNKQVYYYRRKTLANGSKSKYVYIHDNEKHEIIHWLNRFVIDVTAKQVIDHTFCEILFERRDDLQSSKISKKKNSYMTYAAGIVSNIMRNPDQDIAKAQLKDIQTLFDAINGIYSDDGYLSDEIGHSHITKQKNKIPKQIKFKPA